MSTHTPGPWHVIEDGPIIRIHFSLPDGRQSGSAVTIGSTALQFRAPRQGSHRGEKMVYRPFADHDRADALLIAAAPELLAALRLCRSALNEEIIAAGDLDHPTIRAHAEICERADAVIARAEGRR
jgi:hypothetical protein